MSLGLVGSVCKPQLFSTKFQPFFGVSLLERRQNSFNYEVYKQTTIVELSNNKGPFLIKKEKFHTSNSFSKNQESLIKKANKLIEQSTNFIEKYIPGYKRYVENFVQGCRTEKDNFILYWKIMIRTAMRPSEHSISYQESMTVYMMNRDFKKVAILLPIFMLPGGMFIIFIPVYLFPRYILPISFWSRTQRKMYFSQISQERFSTNSVVLHHLNYHKLNHPDSKTRYTLDKICSSIQSKNIPSIHDLLEFKPICSLRESPFDIDQMDYMLLKSFARIAMLSSIQPIFLLRRKLRAHAKLILCLDKNLRQNRLIDRLSMEDLEYAALMRGLNSAQLSKEANLYWMKNWLSLTQNCDDDDVWFVLHATILLSDNYTEISYKRRVFD